ncbi:MAG: molecular chaperone [Planctomycetota bacterium]
MFRANTYHALARALGPPSAWDDTLRQALPAEPGRLAEALELAFEDRESAAVAHAKLFLGPFQIHAPPYASLYLDPQRRLMGPVSEEAARAYAEAGLAPSDGPRDAPDHVSHELEFMYFLAFQEATAGEPVWAERQRRFWRNHLGRWLPDLARAIARAGLHPFYDALAEFLESFARSEETWFCAGERRA